MVALLEPITGFISAAEFAPRIVGPPRSTLTAEQIRSSKRDELNFRHSVGRGAKASHAQAVAWLQRCLDVGALVPLESSVLVHRLARGEFTATGLIADVSVTAYDSGLVKRHETTIAKTERKMVRYLRKTRMLGNPVALAHRSHPSAAAELDRHTHRPADVAFEAIDGTHHALWIVAGAPARELCGRFRDALYITDGHHRLAAASSLAVTEGMRNPHLPAGLFSETELRLWAYARAISRSQVSSAYVLRTLQQRFELQESDRLVPRPTRAHQIGVRIDRRSFLLTIPDALIPSDPYDRLDVNLLQDLVLEPLFGVTNARTDDRLDFVADTSDDTHDCDSYDAWFLPYPPAVRDVMEVADTGRSMPPKSTYFTPKLPSGLVIRGLDAG